MADKAEKKEIKDSVQEAIDNYVPAKLRVTNAVKEYIQDQKRDMLDVTVEIYTPETEEDGSDTIIEEKRFTYPLETASDGIREDLKKVLDTYNLEQVTAIKNAAHEAAQKKADQTIEELDDLIIDSEEETSDTKEEEGK